MVRKSLSKRLRFEIFKRDSFTCQYCGGKPPKIPLEVDHIVPVSKGGKNDEINLITSCFDCNRGKSNKELNNVIIPDIDKYEKMKIAQKQYKDIKKLIDNEKKIIDDQIKEVENVYSLFFPEWLFSDSFKVSVKKFILALGIQDVCASMETACSRVTDSKYALKYFCGICWTKIKEPNERT